MLQNFPMQSAATHCLQLAMMEGWDAGLKICCPIHDAWVLECPTEKVDETVSLGEQILMEASSTVLDGFVIGVDTDICNYPDRIGSAEPGAIEMWDKIRNIVPEIVT